MQEYGIKIEDINKANVDVHLVYTIKGSQSMEFMQMLTILYGVHFKNKLYEYRATKDRIQESAKDSNWG